jgi:thiol-disulfide isomerase/thioredoxin
MKKNIALLLLPFLIYSCTRTGVVIKGKLKNSPQGSYIYLQELLVTGKGLTDSVLLDKSGSFKFKKEITNPSFFTLRVGQQHNNLVTILSMPGERIKIKGQADSLLQTYSVEGSEESKNVQLVTRRLTKTINCLDSLNQVYQQFLSSPNIENIRTILTANYTTCLEEQRQFSISFIKTHTSSLTCLMALYQQINSKTYVFDKEEDLTYFLKVDSALYLKYRDIPHMKALHANVQQMQEQNRLLKLQRMLSIMGAKAPEIALPSPKGDTVRLSSFKGKVVLLDFWASWCKPCRIENPKLIPIYYKYKSKGFEIFQVSLDKTKEDWINAIRTDGLWWTHVSDLKYWQSPVVTLYNFESIPTSYLIDKDGTIIGKDLRGEALQQKLEDILGEKSNTASK